jgi:signal transduction histidine kinase
MVVQWTFRQKAVAGYAAMILLSALLLAFSIHALHTLHDAAEAITEGTAQILSETAKLQDSAERASSSGRGFLMTKAATHLADLEDARAEFHQSVGRLRTMLEDGKCKQLLSLIHHKEREHRAALDPLLELRRASLDVEGIGRLYEDRVNPTRQELDASIDALMSRQDEKFHQAVSDYTVAAQRTVPTIYGLTALCLLAILGVAAIFTRMLSRQYEVERVARHAREETLALVSHDLKNPLNAILMCSSMIEQEASSGDAGTSVRKHAAIIQRAVGRMSSLLSDLLDASSIESGRFRVEAKPVSVGLLVDEAIEAISPVATLQSLRIDKDLQDPEALIHGDRGRLLQVFGNLLGNATRFTPEGGRIVIQVGPEGPRMRFAVSNSGKGIPPEEREHLFERFRRGARSNGGGTGLGLYIVKGIVEAHGGEAWVESSVTDGTTVFFTIPRMAR